MSKQILLVAFVGGWLCAGTTVAQTPPPAPGTPSGNEAQCQMMNDDKPGMPGMPGMKPENCAHCAEMMKAHETLQAELVALDAKLDGLMAKVDTAKGNQRVDALAAVLHELIVQRKGMREHMEAMQHMAMQSMMHHMQMGMMGMMEGMMDAGGDCPMMHEGHEHGEHEHPHPH